MTTIAYKDGVLAADSLITSANNARCGSVRKIGEAGDMWWAYSGATHQMESFEQWAKSGMMGDPPKFENQGVGIIVSPGGIVREWWGDGWLEITSDAHAWGSGERIARGAMMAGASAKRAIEIAIALDIETGGEVQELRRAT